MLTPHTLGPKPGTQTQPSHEAESTAPVAAHTRMLARTKCSLVRQKLTRGRWRSKASIKRPAGRAAAKRCSNRHKASACSSGGVEQGVVSWLVFSALLAQRRDLIPCCKMSHTRATSSPKALCSSARQLDLSEVDAACHPLLAVCSARALSFSTTRMSRRWTDRLRACAIEDRSATNATAGREMFVVISSI